MKIFRILFIYSILFILEFNNLQSQDNLKDLIISEISCPRGGILVSGTQVPYLYIETTISGLEFYSSIDQKLKSIPLRSSGGEHYKIDLKTKGKQTITISKNSYSTVKIRIESEMEDGDCKGYTIEEKNRGISSEKKYPYKFNIAPKDAKIIINNVYGTLIYKNTDKDSLEEREYNIKITKEGYRDTTIKIHPSENENSKIISLVPSIGYVDFDALAIAQEYFTTVEITNEKKNPLRTVISKNLENLLKLFTQFYSKNVNALEIPLTIATKNGIEIINQIWKNRKFKTNETELHVDLINRNKNTNYEIRNIPLKQIDDEGNTVYQDAVFTITEDGMIDDLKFGVTEHQYKEVMKRGLSAIEESRRFVILSFVENLSTAYYRKDIKYIENFFSDNAYNIVGKVISKQKSIFNLENILESEKVQFIKLSRQEIINNLKSTFINNSFIIVKNDSIEITQSRMNNVFYAVNLVQDWKTTRYSDKGYLFLLIDFTIEDKPTIHVRAWEPHKQTKKADRISLGDFSIEPPE